MAACASLQAALPNARFEGRGFPVPMYERLCLQVQRLLQTSLQLLDVLEDGAPRAPAAVHHSRRGAPPLALRTAPHTLPKALRLEPVAQSPKPLASSL